MPLLISFSVIHCMPQHCLIDVSEGSYIVCGVDATMHSSLFDLVDYHGKLDLPLSIWSKQTAVISLYLHMFMPLRTRCCLYKLATAPSYIDQHPVLTSRTSSFSRRCLSTAPCWRYQWQRKPACLA